MNAVSFMTANYVARQVGFHRTDWMHGQNAVDAYYRPIESYAERFAELLDTIHGLGFDAVDLWLPHLHPEWATDAHIAIATQALSGRGMRVASLAGWFGETAAEFARSCRLAQAVGTRILGGMSAVYQNDRQAMFHLLEQYDCLMAIENHPEKDPAEVLSKIGEGGRLGTCIDTGIWASKGVDPIAAIQALRPHIMHVHLKDEIPGLGTTIYGQGVVPLEKCARALVDSGYTGGFSVEHEPLVGDPSADAAVSAAMLRGWLGSA